MHDQAIASRRTVTRLGWAHLIPRACIDTALLSPARMHPFATYVLHSYYMAICTLISQGPLMVRPQPHFSIFNLMSFPHQLFSTLPSLADSISPFRNPQALYFRRHIQ
jgi:hypothetical protein